MKKYATIIIFFILSVIPFTRGISQTIEELGNTNGFERSWGVALTEDGAFAYVPGKGESNPTVWIINIASPTNPVEVGKIEIPNPAVQTPEAWGVKVSGNLLYVAAFKCGLHIYDITNPVSPTPLGIYDSDVESREVFVAGNYAYVAESWKGLRILDVSNPTTPTNVALYNTGGELIGDDAEFHDVKVVGSYAYCAGGKHNMVIVDVSDPASPSGVGYYSNEIGWGRGIDVSGDYAYLGDNVNGLRVIDIKDPANPKEVGSYVAAGELWKLDVVGNEAFVPYAGSFIAFDISGHQDPVEITSVSLLPGGGGGQAVLIKNTYAYVVSSNSLIIYDVGSILTSIEDDFHAIPDKYALHQNYPNPFNPVTTIEYYLEKPGWITLKVFDITGKEVAILVNSQQGTGTHRISWKPTDLPSGIYFYTLRVNEFSQTRKLMLMR